MGRWKQNNDGSAYFDSNDSGPDQTAPPGAPPAQEEQQQYGWGPIKVSGTYNPHPQSPGDFWSHIGSMGPGKGADQGQSPNAGGVPGSMTPPGIMKGNEPVQGSTPGWQKGPMQPGIQMPQGGGLPPWARDFPPYGMPHGPGPWLQQVPNTAGSPTPNEGEDYNGMFSRFLNDYHAPDRDQVLQNIIRNDPNPTFSHLDNMPLPFPGNSYQPPTGIAPKGGGGFLGALGGALRGAPQLGPSTSLIQQLLARKMNGGV